MRTALLIVLALSGCASTVTADPPVKIGIEHEGKHVATYTMTAPKATEMVDGGMVLRGEGGDSLTVHEGAVFVVPFKP